MVFPTSELNLVSYLECFVNNGISGLKANPLLHFKFGYINKLVVTFFASLEINILEGNLDIL